jgi:hypothetical protein
MRRPWLRIPPKFVLRDPCQRRRRSAVWDVGVGGCVEPVVFALPLDAEDVHDLVAHIVCLAARVLEVVLEFDELV